MFVLCTFMKVTPTEKLLLKKHKISNSCRKIFANSKVCLLVWLAIRCAAKCGFWSRFKLLISYSVSKTAMNDHFINFLASNTNLFTCKDVAAVKGRVAVRWLVGFLQLQPIRLLELWRDRFLTNEIAVCGFAHAQSHSFSHFVVCSCRRIFYP